METIINEIVKTILTNTDTPMKNIYEIDMLMRELDFTSEVVHDLLHSMKRHNIVGVYQFRRNLNIGIQFDGDIVLNYTYGSVMAELPISSNIPSYYAIKDLLKTYRLLYNA